jgi:hypothetical protein
VGFDELEVDVYSAYEERCASAKDDGADEQAVFVDDPTSCQGCCESRAADGDRPALLLLGPDQVPLLLLGPSGWGPFARARVREE